MPLTGVVINKFQPYSALIMFTGILNLVESLT